MNSSNGIVTNVCPQTAHEHAWVDTDQFGLILGCNAQAATFLGTVPSTPSVVPCF